ncbi:sigma-70 family RNA polymerase sigma factor [Cumulibacter manganitolerans]|uniref:sigma-70 family RNA polymerase sigma factor n=1 Tax=Cumulibacter manganitolerans TaxID=1884992 RepID=UPI001E5D880F|nr:sigma-70 family RNA polymerase sigma factor [Cumulibacter manganitolerans]
MSAHVNEDERLLRALFAEHGAALWSFVVPLVHGDAARAEDVVQETMLRAWRRPEILAQRRGSVRSWLFTVARRIVIDQWRHDGRSEGTAELTADPSDPAQTGAVEDLLERLVVAEALDRLTPAHRSVLQLCYYDGCTTAEAARRLGIPEGTVKSRAHYALEALQLALREIGVTP